MSLYTGSIHKRYELDIVGGGYLTPQSDAMQKMPCVDSEDCVVQSKQSSTQLQPSFAHLGKEVTAYLVWVNPRPNGEFCHKFNRHICLKTEPERNRHPSTGETNSWRGLHKPSFYRTGIAATDLPNMT